MNVPPSVSRAAVQAEFEFYGIDEDTSLASETYDGDYFHELAEEIASEGNQRAAMNAAKKSAQLMKEQSCQREVTFFIMLEYYKINPSPGTSLVIDIPVEYRRHAGSTWVHQDLMARGFRVGVKPFSPVDTMTVRRVIMESELINANE